MARVRRQKASGRARRVCGHAGCGREIPKGEEYYTWTPRSTGRQVRCLEHPPKQSDLTASRMSEVYAAMETAEEELSGNTETVEDVTAVVATVAEAAREVCDEYRTAADAFGGGGPNAERADELEGWVDELEAFEPDESDVEEFDEDEHAEEAKELCEEEGDLTFADAMQRLRDEYEEEHDIETAREEALENARNLARDLMGQCPL